MFMTNIMGLPINICKQKNTSISNSSTLYIHLYINSTLLSLEINFFSRMKHKH